MSPATEAAAALRREIRGGHYTIGTRLSNERLLAERFGVSRGTIRQALQILETERLIARQQGRGTFVANPAHAPVAGTNAALIGALVYEKELYFGGILQSASSQAATRGYVLTTGSNATQQDEQQHVDAFIRSALRGVVLAPTCHSLEAYTKLRDHGIPIVLLDTMIPGVSEDFVSIDNRQGAYLATRHLIQLGHRRLAYVGHDNPLDIPCKGDRIAGFLAACQEAGISVAADRVIEMGEETDHVARLRPILSAPDRPTGIVTFSDAWAVRCIAAARALNLKVPDDLSVIGFDDSSIARNYDVPITTIHPEFSEVGTRAVGLLVEKIENRRPRPTVNILVTPRLVERLSTAAVKRSSGNAA